MKAAITGVLAILLLVGWFSFFSDSMTAKDEELSDDELADIKNGSPRDSISAPHSFTKKLRRLRIPRK